MGDRYGNVTIDGIQKIKDLKVVDLKKELEQRGLNKYGNKKELVQRLAIFEEGRQRSLSAKAKQETPNQWIEEDSNLNNDFIRDYFRSQKARFQEHNQHRNKLGESGAAEPSAKSLVSNVEKSLDFPARDAATTSSPNCPAAPTFDDHPEKTKGVKLTIRKNVDKSETSIIPTEVPPETTKPSLKETEDRTQSPTHHRSRRKQHVDPPISIIDGNDTQKSHGKNATEGPPAPQKVASLKIKLAEPVDRNPVQDGKSSKPAAESADVIGRIREPSASMSPQNAEISSSVSDGSPRSFRESPLSRQSLAGSSKDNDSKILPSLDKKLVKDRGRSSRLKDDTVKGNEKVNTKSLPKKDSVKSKKAPPITDPDLEDEIIKRGFEEPVPKPLIEGVYIPQKPLNPLGLNKLSNLKKPNVTASTSQKPIRKSSRVIPTRTKTDIVQNDSCAKGVVSKDSENPSDSFEILKQQIALPLHVENFPSEKSEVSSTSELMEPALMPMVRLERLGSHLTELCRETPILDSHMIVEGHIDKDITPDSGSDSSHLRGGNSSEGKMDKKVEPLAKKEEITSPSRKERKNSYLIENLLEKSEQPEINLNADHVEQTSITEEGNTISHEDAQQTVGKETPEAPIDGFSQSLDILGKAALAADIKEDISDEIPKTYETQQNLKDLEMSGTKSLKNECGSIKIIPDDARKSDQQKDGIDENDPEVCLKNEDESVMAVKNLIESSIKSSQIPNSLTSKNLEEHLPDPDISSKSVNDPCLEHDPEKEESSKAVENLLKEQEAEVLPSVKHVSDKEESSKAVENLLKEQKAEVLPSVEHVSDKEESSKAVENLLEEQKAEISLSVEHDSDKEESFEAVENLLKKQNAEVSPSLEHMKDGPDDAVSIQMSDKVPVSDNTAIEPSLSIEDNHSILLKQDAKVPNVNASNVKEVLPTSDTISDSQKSDKTGDQLPIGDEEKFVPLVNPAASKELDLVQQVGSDVPSVDLGKVKSMVPDENTGVEISPVHIVENAKDILLTNPPNEHPLLGTDAKVLDPHEVTTICSQMGQEELLLPKTIPIASQLEPSPNVEPRLDESKPSLNSAIIPNDEPILDIHKSLHPPFVSELLSKTDDPADTMDSDDTSKSKDVVDDSMLNVDQRESIDVSEPHKLEKVLLPSTEKETIASHEEDQKEILLEVAIEDDSKNKSSDPEKDSSVSELQSPPRKVDENTEESPKLIKSNINSSIISRKEESALVAYGDSEDSNLDAPSDDDSLNQKNTPPSSSKEKVVPISPILESTLERKASSDSSDSDSDVSTTMGRRRKVTADEETTNGGTKEMTPTHTMTTRRRSRSRSLEPEVVSTRKSSRRSKTSKKESEPEPMPQDEEDSRKLDIILELNESMETFNDDFDKELEEPLKESKEVKKSDKKSERQRSKSPKESKGRSSDSRRKSKRKSPSPSKESSRKKRRSRSPDKRRSDSEKLEKKRTRSTSSEDVSSKDKKRKRRSPTPEERVSPVKTSPQKVSQEDEAKGRRSMTPEKSKVSPRKTSSTPGELPSETTANGTLKDQEKSPLVNTEDASQALTNVEPEGSKEPEVRSPFKSARTVSLNRTKSSDASAPNKKPKWGSSTQQKQSISISSDSLKSLIPDVKPLPTDDVHLDESSDAGRKSPSPDPELERPRHPSSDRKERLSRDFSDDPSNKPIKRERIVYNSPPPKSRERRRTEDEEPRTDKSKPTTVMAPTVVPAARHSISRVVLVQNLVRPFTVKQLKDLLQRTGKLVENGFWIDNIKSKCIAMYENEDQSIETRIALHGVKWPTINPKNLHVDFSSEAELKKRLSESPHLNPIIADEPRLSKKKVDGPIREWDLAKMGEKSPGEREREREKQRREREEERMRNKERQREHSPEPDRSSKKSSKGKSLDDIFNKTKIQPAIYWLPLTPQQISEKEAQRRKRMAESAKLLAEISAQEERQRQEREKERLKRREKEKERRRRSRSRSRRRSRSPKRSPRRSRRSSSQESRSSRRRSRSRTRSRS